MATDDNGPGIEQKSQERNYDDIVNNQQAITDHLNCLDDHDVAMGARDRFIWMQQTPRSRHQWTHRLA